MMYLAEVDGTEFQVEILDEHHVRFGEQVLEVDLAGVSGQPLYSLIVNGESFEGYVYPDERKWQVLLRGRSYSVSTEDERQKRLLTTQTSPVSAVQEFSLKAPMPGLIVDVLVREGQEVSKGDVLVVLESMKMQNELRSPRAGRISRLKVRTGETIEQKQFLLVVS